MKVFVTGGGGFVGSRIVPLLLEAGHEVACLVRRPEEAVLPAKTRLIEGDALKPAGFAESLRGFDAVINLIGILRAFPSSGITFRRLHVDATLNMVRTALDVGIKRFIQMSANGARPEGIAEYQTTKWEAEEIVKSSGLDWTIFRPCLVFGPAPKGKTEFCSQLARLLKYSPAFPVFNGGDYRFQPVHVDDVARCFVGALDNAEAVKRIFHLGGNDTFSYRMMLDFICLGMGVSPGKKINLPWKTVRPFVALLGKLPFFPATHYQIDMLVEGNIVPEKEYREIFGIKPKEFSAENLSYLQKI